MIFWDITILALKGNGAEENLSRECFGKVKIKRLRRILEKKTCHNVRRELR